MTRLGSLFNSSIIGNLKTKLDLKNNLSVPKLLKVVVSAGCGKHLKDQHKIDFIFNEITKITGQYPVVAKAKKSVAGFMVREGMTSGVFVTLRKKNMYNFIDRLVYIALPRVRDFHGISEKAFDGNGNYNLGVKDHEVFLESGDMFSFGLNIALITTATTDESCKQLLVSLGFPFRERSHDV